MARLRLHSVAEMCLVLLRVSVAMAFSVDRLEGSLSSPFISALSLCSSVSVAEYEDCSRDQTLKCSSGQDNEGGGGGKHIDAVFYRYAAPEINPAYA